MSRRRDQWWVRELERVNRAHTEQLDSLISVIAHLAGNPVPTWPTAPVRTTERDPDALLDLVPNAAEDTGDFQY